MKKFLEQTGEQEGFEISGFSSLAGGSINEVFLLETSQGKRVVKINESTRFPQMFEAEKQGLEELKSSNSFRIPEVYSVGNIGDRAYLILEFISEGFENAEFRQSFAEQLAALHRNTAPEFGFYDSNYIGSLPQYNEKRGSAADFYIDQRLRPQLKMASERGFSFSGLENILKNIAAVIPDDPASLIHGDLWNGNYLATADHCPCLIDPAVSYGPREMDLSMMKLFGGFSKEIYSLYSEIFPLQADFEERVPLWQLYYLLVHLNIFGSSYQPSVENILKKYS